MFQTFWGNKLDSADGARGSLTLLAATFAAYMALGPLRLYLQNRYYYDLDALTVIFAALGLFLVLFVLIYGIAGLVQPTARATYLRVLLCFLAAVFVYDNVLFFLVPELDGSTQAVTSSLFVGLDVAVIGLLVFLALKTAAFADWQIISRVLFLILAFSGLQLVFAAFSPEGEPDDSLPDEVKEIVLSPNRNIIHVLFDMFQATEFSAALEEVGGEKSLPGFVWFKDSLGVHSSTSFSLPSIFAGRIYREDNMRGYYSGEDKTFLDILSANNFDQTVFTALPIPGGVDVRKQRAIALLDERQSVVSELGQLLDLFFTRAGPFLIKNFFLNDYNYRLARLDRQTTPVGNDRYKHAFVNFADRLVVSENEETKDRYYFLHLIYPHPPYTHNADCSAADGVVPRSPQQSRLELRCSLRDFVAFLERLKEAGV